MSCNVSYTHWPLRVHLAKLRADDGDVIYESPFRWRSGFVSGDDFAAAFTARIYRQDAGGLMTDESFAPTPSIFFNETLGIAADATATYFYQAVGHHCDRFDFATGTGLAIDFRAGGAVSTFPPILGGLSAAAGGTTVDVIHSNWIKRFNGATYVSQTVGDCALSKNANGSMLDDGTDYYVGRSLGQTKRITKFSIAGLAEGASLSAATDFDTHYQLTIHAAIGGGYLAWASPDSIANNWIVTDSTLAVQFEDSTTFSRIFGVDVSANLAVASGITNPQSPGAEIVCKLPTGGAAVWTAHYDGSGNCKPYITADESAVYVVGSFVINGVPIGVLKLDAADGALIWAASIGRTPQGGFADHLVDAGDALYVQCSGFNRY